MFALIVALALTSPTLERPAPACSEWGWPLEATAGATAKCRASCRWWAKIEQRCRDVDVEYLGEWDPRPINWGGASYSPPPAWGTYPTEHRE